jgi:hypothetical protein
MRTVIVGALLAIASGLLALGTIIFLDLRLGVPPQSGLPTVGACFICCALVAAILLWGRPDRRLNASQVPGRKQKPPAARQATFHYAIILAPRSEAESVRSAGKKNWRDGYIG